VVEPKEGDVLFSRAIESYFALKAQRPDVLLLMRMGDFYEAYGDDAATLASALGITLTSRQDGVVPMAGVPFHCVEKYLAVLIQKGFTTALIDFPADASAMADPETVAWCEGGIKVARTSGHINQEVADWASNQIDMGKRLALDGCDTVRKIAAALNEWHRQETAPEVL
jgi:DNA mismatch repair ATPase MutS